MFIKKIILVLIILAFSVGTILFMYDSYDPLGRYNYDDEVIYKKIISKLNSDDLQYIVTYQIDPYEFYRYLDAENFSIYHVKQYNKIIPQLFYLDLDKQVDFVEEMIKYDANIDQVVDYLNSYNYTDLIYWYKYGDSYNDGSYLLKEPDYFDTYLDDNRTISIKEPKNLVYLDDFGIELVKEPADQLLSMCQAMDLNLETSGCGYLNFTSGYISYNEQKEIYENALKKDSNSAILEFDLPGHSENQLGFAFDLLVSENLYTSDAYNWLVSNSYKFGYILSLTEESASYTNKLARLNHFRYVGLDVSLYMHETGKSFKEVSNG